MTTATDVFQAIADDNPARVKELLASDPAVAMARDAGGLSAITQACYHGRDEILAALLDTEPELDLFEAAAAGHAGRARELVERDPGSAAARSLDGFTALHLASFFGHLELARLLLDRGADVNAVAHNDMKVLPLHSAAASGRLEIAKLLVERGADVSAAQQHGFTPLHAAAQNGDVELARVLLDRGADVGQATDAGKTAATFAADGGHREIQALLGER